MNLQRANGDALLIGIFDDLGFPAARWEIVIRAQEYGLGGRVLHVLWELGPEGATSLDALAEWLTARLVHGG